MKPSGKNVVIAILSGLAIACQAQPGFQRKQNFTDEALARYAELSDTTILRSSSLPVLTNSLISELPADTNEAAAGLKEALLAHGIELAPLHGLFTMAVPPGWSNTPLAALIARVPVEGVEERPWKPGTQPGPTGEIIPPGMIDFINADLNQALQLYAELVNKTLLRSTQLPMVQVTLKTQTPVSKAAAIYAVRASLALLGFGIVQVGDKLEAILTWDQATTFSAPESKSVPDNSVVALNDIPQFRWTAAQQVVDYYAKVAERTTVAAPGLGESRIVFKAQTPLAKSELLQALDTVLMLNGLAIVEGDDKSIHLERNKRASK